MLDVKINEKVDVMSDEALIATLTKEIPKYLLRVFYYYDSNNCGWRTICGFDSLPTWEEMKRAGLVKEPDEIRRQYIIVETKTKKSVFKYPRGKLNARDLGIRNANGEIIVSVDADVFAPVNWLNLLLRHFRCPRDNCRWSSVVAVSGPTIGEYGALDSLYLWRFLLYGNSPLQLKRLYGRNSAFRREAYFLANGFNLEVDQFDLNSIINEEEFNFARRLSEFGKYVFDLQASVFTQNRRVKCGNINVKTCEISDPLCRYCREIEEGERF